MKTPYFLFEFIKQLREKETVVLYNNFLAISQHDSTETSKYLFREYNREALNFPFSIPEFDESAAIYAASQVYYLSQVLLYRKHNLTELQSLFLQFDGELTSSSILSVDLVFRFLPDYKQAFSEIDSEDIVIDFIDALLSKWHYSAIPFVKNIENLSFNPIIADPCMKQMYINRIIESKCTQLAQLPIFYEDIKAILGDYKPYFWATFV